MNNTPKFVVSTTLQEPLEWSNSTLIKGNLADEIDKLKQQPGKDIGISGSGTLVGSLLQEDLLEELRLMVRPVVVGSGRRLFEEGGDSKNLESLSTQRRLARVSSTSPTGRRAAETIRGSSVGLRSTIHRSD
jgi:dihydrofolate reductase